MKKSRLLSLLLALTLLASLVSLPTIGALAAYELPADLDISEKVELVIYILGDEKTGQQEMTDNFNKIALEKLNCTIKINWISFAEWPNKYPLLFSSGEVFDMAYAATWLNFASMAQKGAFMPLDELWPKYAPNNWALQSETAKFQATSEGQLYAVPTLLATYSGYGPLYRLDLVEGVEGWTGKMENFEDVENYLALVKANHPAVEPYYVYASGSEADDQFMYYDGIYGIKGSTGDFLFIDPSQESPQLFTYWEYERTPDFLQMMKRWNDNGYFPKSGLSDTDADKQKYGKVGLRFHNMDTYTDYVMNHPDYTWAYANFVKDVSNMSFVQDAMVVSNTSKHPDRALALYDMITTDEEAFRAFFYGIEGVSYKVTEEDGVAYVNSLDVLAYPFSNMWSARTKAFYKNPVGYPQDAVELKLEWDAYIKDGVGTQKFRSFTIDTSTVETEYAACQSVHQQYWWPLELAYVDVEAGLKEYQEKMEAAGINKVREVLQAQLDAYLISIQ